MPAFNARLMPKEMFGMPLVGVIALVIAIMLGAFILPLWGSAWGYALVFVVACVVVFALLVISAGEDFPFLRFRVISARDINSRTSEAIETE